MANQRALKESKVMSYSVVDAIVSKTIDYAGEYGIVNFGFQGGEPLLASIEYYKYFIKKVNELKKKGQKIHYSLQSNGIELNEENCRLLKENEFLVGLSLDGFEENHNFFRKDQKQKGTYQNVIAAKELLEHYGIEYNVLTVLTNELSEKAGELYEFYKEQKIRYVQLIPCLSDLNNNNRLNLKVENFKEFYQQLLGLWLEDLNNNQQIGISLFEDIIGLLSGNGYITCGSNGKCAPQLVVEADGSCYPCDFYALDEYFLGNICDKEIEELLQRETSKRFIKEKREQESYCSACQFVKLCNSGCKRMNHCFLNEKECGLKPIIEKLADVMYQ